MVDTGSPELEIEVGRLERTFTWLVNHLFTRERRHFRHDLPTRLSMDQDPSARARLPYTCADSL